MLAVTGGASHTKPLLTKDYPVLLQPGHELGSEDDQDQICVVDNLLAPLPLLPLAWPGQLAELLQPLASY